MSKFKTILLRNGDVYEGDTKNGEFHGQGTYYWLDGQRYVGNWMLGRRDGFGRYYYANGDLYEGKVLLDLKHSKKLYFRYYSTKKNF